jgi:outer membrane protein
MANEGDHIATQMDVNNSMIAIANQEMAMHQSEIELIQVAGMNMNQKIKIIDSIQIDRNLVEAELYSNLQRNTDYIYADNIVRINELLLKETKATKYPSLRMNAAYNYIYTKVQVDSIC